MSRFNFAALNIDSDEEDYSSSPVAVKPLIIVYPFPGEAARAVELVQSDDIYGAMMRNEVSWGDIGWAEDYVAEERARAQRRARGEPMTPPPSPRVLPVEDGDGWNIVGAGATNTSSSSAYRTWVVDEHTGVDDDDDADSTCSTATWDSYYDPRLCTAEEYEWYLGQRKLAKIHRDENGEPEECRFFNSAHGCREGDKCPYKHIKRSLSEIPCRFFGMSMGCRKGSACPYKHG